MYDEKRFLLIETALVAEKIMRKEPVLLIKFSPLPGIFYGIKKKRQCNHPIRLQNSGQVSFLVLILSPLTLLETEDHGLLL
jgi:hypothetical protein